LDIHLFILHLYPEVFWELSFNLSLQHYFPKQKICIYIYIIYIMFGHMCSKKQLGISSLMWTLHLPREGLSWASERGSAALLTQREPCSCLLISCYPVLAITNVHQGYNSVVQCLPHIHQSPGCDTQHFQKWMHKWF
jgi:hypothetical protein